MLCKYVYRTEIQKVSALVALATTTFYLNLIHTVAMSFTIIQEILAYYLTLMMNGDDNHRRSKIQDPSSQYCSVVLRKAPINSSGLHHWRTLSLKGQNPSQPHEHDTCDDKPKGDHRGLIHRTHN